MTFGANAFGEQPYGWAPTSLPPAPEGSTLFHKTDAGFVPTRLNRKAGAAFTAATLRKVSAPA